MGLRKWLVFITAFAVSCGPYWAKTGSTTNYPGNITVCLQLPKDQLPLAHIAVAEWDTVLANWERVIPIDNAPDPGICTIQVRIVDKPLADIPNALAWCSCVGCRDISRYAGHYEQDISGILQHEIGHALGAQHVPGTLMNATWEPNKFVCPDRTTVTQVAAWNHVDVTLLSWCYF